MTTEDIETYKKTVDDVGDRLRDLCDRWSRELAENERLMTEETVQKIHSVIGKSQLLRTSKFEQFRTFLNDAERKTIGKLVKLDDIRGFWETIHLQVDEVNKTFEELDALKKNKYVILDAVTVPDGVGMRKPTRKQPAPCKKPVVSASSNLKSFISAQRERKKLDGVGDGVCIAEKVPSNGHA